MDGDNETNQALVLDNGGGTIKAGFAGMPKPQLNFPSCVGRPKFPRCMAEKRTEKEIYTGKQATDLAGILSLSFPISSGVVTDWNEMTNIWSALFDELKVTASKHPILLTQAPLNSRENQKKLLDVFFETFEVPAVHIALQSVLSLYASGRTTGVVVDSGDGSSSVVPIVEGFVLSHSIQRADMAGRDVTNYLARLLQQSGKGFYTSAEMVLLDDIKRKSSYVSITALKSDFARERDLAIGASQNAGTATYEMPDSTKLVIGNERSKAPELLFNPSLMGLEYPGIHQMLSTAISRTDVSLRRTLAQQIVLSGGSTMCNGYVERLLAEMRRLQPKDSLIRIYAPSDREYTTFVGGAILGSLPAFQKLWITKSEYDEEGSLVLFKKGI